MRYYPKVYSPPTTAPAVDLRLFLNRAYLGGRLTAKTYNVVWGNVYFNGMCLQRFKRVLETGEAMEAYGVGCKSLAELQGLFL